MELGPHEAWKAADGAADGAWNETGSPSISSIKFSTIISSNYVTRKNVGRPPKGANLIGSGSRGSATKGSSLSLPVGSDGATGCSFLELPPALILEIFTRLDARELCVVACVCSLFRRLAADCHGWKDFYCERWGLPAPSTAEESCLALPGKHWRELYVAKEARSKSMMGRFSMDMLHGHTAAVRAVRMLPAANLICSAGYDQTVRLWNLEEGLPLACSRSLGETIRAIAVDTNVLAVGDTSAAVRLWHADSDCPHLFNVGGGGEVILYGHTGPVTCLGLDSGNIYSGSWDMSIKVWSRSSLKCCQSLRHMDWNWALALRGGRVLSTAGSDVYSWDVETGRQLMVRTGVHSGQALAVEGTRSGHIVFTGGEDGGVRMFDDRISRRKQSWTDPNTYRGATVHSGLKEAVASWTPHSSTVYSLAFDDPWLVSASGDGFIAMMDVRQIMKRAAGASRHNLGGNARWRRSGQYLVSKEGETAQRRLSGFHQSAYCVDLGADRVVSGGEEKVVRVWDFSQALEIERRVQAARSSQLEHRFRRRQQHVAAKGCAPEPKHKHLEGAVPGGEIDVRLSSEESVLGGSDRYARSKDPRDRRGLVAQGGVRGKTSTTVGPVCEFIRSRPRARSSDKKM